MVIYIVIVKWALILPAAGMVSNGQVAFMKLIAELPILLFSGAHGVNFI